MPKPQTPEVSGEFIEELAAILRAYNYTIARGQLTFGMKSIAYIVDSAGTCYDALTERLSYV